MISLFGQQATLFNCLTVKLVPIIQLLYGYDDDDLLTRLGSSRVLLRLPWNVIYLKLSGSRCLRLESKAGICY